MKNDIEALRGFAIDICHIAMDVNIHDIQSYEVVIYAVNHGLLDRDYNKTEILTGSKSRIQDAQRRLYWAWMTDMSKTQVESMGGRTKDDWHWEMKNNFLIPIFVRDDSEFAEMYSTYVEIYNYYRFNDKKSAIINKKFLGDLSITDATKDQATEYLKDIESFCWEKGIQLRTDMALYKTAMGLL